MCRIFSRTRRVPAAYPLTRSLRTRCVPAAYSPRTCFVYTRHLHQMASVSFAAGLRQVWPRHPPGHLPAKTPGNLQGTFGALSGNPRDTFWKSPENLLEAFGNLQVPPCPRWRWSSMGWYCLESRCDRSTRGWSWAAHRGSCFMSFWVRRVGRGLPRRHVLLSAPGRACSPFPADVIAVG